MNEIFLIGEIVTEIDFKFILNSKHISIALFEIELLNRSIVKVKAYDDMADFVYSKLIKGDIIFIYGSMETSGCINCLYIGKTFYKIPKNTLHLPQKYI